MEIDNLQSGQIDKHLLFATDSAFTETSAYQDVVEALSEWIVHPATDWQSLDGPSSPPSVGLFFISDEAASDAASLSALNRLLSRHKGVEWIAISTQTQLENPAYTELLAHHVNDYFTYPLIDLTHRLNETLGHASGMAKLRAAQHQHRQKDQSDFGIIGTSPAMKKIYNLMPRLASSVAPILISGDTGTGKELIANTIHNLSPRGSAPFIAVNCGAIPENLVESELFGHSKGAFTGADSDKIGLIQAADGGTLLLDEIGDLPPSQQVKLLRFLQEGTINPVGCIKPVEINARVIAATHIDLEKAMLNGDFREDLFYRLNVLQIHTPNLKERPTDIEVLARHFLEMFKDEASTVINGFSDSTIAAMKIHHWRGNVRELMNRIRKGVVLCTTRLIEPEDIGLTLAPESADNNKIIHLADCVGVAEKEAVLDALHATQHNVSKAARKLNVSRMTLYRLLQKHQISAAS